MDLFGGLDKEVPKRLGCMKSERHGEKMHYVLFDGTQPRLEAWSIILQLQPPDQSQIRSCLSMQSQRNAA
jgi:hypothetical protein